MKKTITIDEQHKKAEARAAFRQARVETHSAELVSKHLLNELQVHQIELEAQNEELRQANAEISEHKERLLHIIKKTPAGYFHLDLEGRFLDVNGSWLRMHGYGSAKEVIGKHFSMMQVDGSSDSALAHLAELQRGVPIPYGEFLSRRKDGSVGRHIFSAHPVERMGTIVGFEWFIIDITQQKMAVQELEKQKTTFESLFESISDAILLTNQERRIVAINKGFTETFGYTLDEVLGKPTSMIYASEEDFHHQGRLRFNAGAKEAAKPYVVTYRRKDGVLLPGETIGKKVLTPDGEFLGFFALIRDISERIKTDQEKTDLENQLHQAQKIESIGQLAGGVAHDFNNMLGVILGHTELALKKAPPSCPVLSDLEDIHTATNRSTVLTRQLLAFARKQIIAPRVLDLNETIAGTLKMLQRLIGENIQISWNPEANLWPVKVDPSQLDQILANLCVNSKDAIDGVGKISIKTANTSWDENAVASHPHELVPGDYVQLCVSDDGCGMDQDVKAHIFEPFYTTKVVGGGTGLGLATVYGAVKQNQGFLTVYSEPGLGTVFNIYLPRENASVEVVPETAAKTLRCGDETILLVEDDKMLLDMEMSMLEESGYTVLPAITTGLAQTLAKEHTGPIHLLISDMIMPEMNGRELSVRLQPLRPEMKMLFMSGYTADIISKQGVVEDEINFLQKPFSFEALTTKVREVLDDH
jgi:PAS domain S-box-containing protein